MLQHLLDAHTIVVVLEGERLSVSGHLLQLSANRPFVSPATIIQRIADCIIRNRGTIVRSQLILPIRIAVSIRNGFQRRADRAGGIRILHLAQDIPAAIIVVNPRRILMRIIHTDELSQRIISVGSSQITSLFRDDVASIVVGILERDAVLVVTLPRSS